MPFLHRRVQAVLGRFGEAMRELRFQRGYSQESLSHVSGIHVSVIRALEEERLKDLIDPEYAERHVRALVVLLDGHVPYFMEKYQTCLHEMGLGVMTKNVLPPRVRKRDLFVTSRLTAYAGFLVVLCAIAGYVLWQVFLISSRPVLTVAEPQDGVQVFTPSVVVVGETDPSALLEINGRQTVIDANGAFHSVIDIPSGISTIRITSRRRYGSTSAVERHVMYEHSQPTSMQAVVPIRTVVTSTHIY